MPETVGVGNAPVASRIISIQAQLDSVSFLRHPGAVSLPRPLPCAFYRTTAGNEPVREWLKALLEGERKQVGGDIKAVQ